MDKARTTYGVYNLIEWHALLRMGKATVKVPFAGGSITTQGVTPATYTTEDPIVQYAIERSPEFKNKKIRIVRRVKLGGSVEIESNPIETIANQSHADSNQAMQTASEADQVKSPYKESDSMSVVEDGDSTFEKSDDALPAAETPQTGSTTIEVEFSCNDDAKDYLEQTYGCTRSKLRTRADIIAAGEANGVSIIFN